LNFWNPSWAWAHVVSFAGFETTGDTRTISRLRTTDESDLSLGAPSNPRVTAYRVSVAKCGARADPPLCFFPGARNRSFASRDFGCDYLYIRGLTTIG